MRKTKEITLQENGENLIFIIEQMPATKMQLWLLKALSLLCGTELASMDFSLLQKEFKTKGFALLQGLDIAKAEPLINELYSCVRRKVDNALIQVSEQNIDSIITDVRTLFALQKEILTHNFDFFTESPLNGSAEGAQKEQNTFNMLTSPTKSV